MAKVGVNHIRRGDAQKAISVHAQVASEYATREKECEAFAKYEFAILAYRQAVRVGIESA